MSDSFDVIIVGAGATGCWAAKQLTEAGLRVQLLDAGPVRPLFAEKYEKQRTAMAPQFSERAPIQSSTYDFGLTTYDDYVDDIDNPYTTAEGKPFFWIRVRQLGGRMTRWGRRSFRFSDFELKAADHDGDGEPWPITYRDLEKHYDAVETFLGMSGSRDNIPNLPDSLISREVGLDAAGALVRDSIQGRWPDRRVIVPRLMVGGHAELLAAAFATGNLTLRSDAVVSQIEADGMSAEEVVFIDRTKRTRHSVRARVIMLCASTLESTRILLNSGTSKPEVGLANSSGTLGRYLTDHLLGALTWGYLRIPDVSAVTQQSVGFHIPNFTNIGKRGEHFQRGFAIQGFFGDPFTRLKVDDDSEPIVTAKTEALVLTRVAAFGEMLPRFENRVTIDESRVDAWGVPVLKIDCAHTENEKAMRIEMERAIGEIVDELGLLNVHTMWGGLAPPGYGIHEMGTARMGSDRATSVVNSFSQCWDVPNLFVGDGASFVTNGTQNPTLTMMAICSRACSHIVQLLKDGNL